MTKAKKYVPASLLVLCILWAACTQQRQPCLTPLRASLVVESMHLPMDTSTIFTDTILPFAIWVPIAKMPDTLIFPLSDAFTLFLSPADTVCQWLFCASDTTNTGIPVFDTLTFYYARNLQFLSNACGYTYFYSLDSAHTTHHNVDSLHITNSSVTNNANATQQILVYIKPDF